MKRILWLVLAAFVLAMAGSAVAARKVRSPRNTCRLACRKQHQKCVRAHTQRARDCWKQRSACYRQCRKQYPPTQQPPPPRRR